MFEERQSDMKIVPKSKRKNKRHKTTDTLNGKRNEQQHQYVSPVAEAAAVLLFRFLCIDCSIRSEWICFCSASIYMKLCLAFRCSRRGCCWCCCRRCCRPVKRFNSCGSRPQHTHPINTLDVDVFSFIQYSLTNWLNFFFGGCGHMTLSSRMHSALFFHCIYITVYIGCRLFLFVFKFKFPSHTLSLSLSLSVQNSLSVLVWVLSLWR